MDKLDKKLEKLVYLLEFKFQNLELGMNQLVYLIGYFMMTKVKNLKPLFLTLGKLCGVFLLFCFL